jgi:hypothetical protein
MHQHDGFDVDQAVGKQYAELLQATGVDTVKELEQHIAANRAAEMAAVNATRKLTRAVPADKLAARWIEQAKGMPSVLSH